MEPQQSLPRRSILAYAGALLGTSFLPGMDANAQPQNQVAGSFDVKKFGATGSRKDNATKAFRDAIGACTAAGGGTVIVPPGEYTVGTVQLRDNVTLNIEAGATLYTSQREEDFVPGSEALIFAEKATNIGVTGKGAIDGLARYDFTEMNGVDPEIEKEIKIARAAGIDMRRYYRSKEAMNVFLFVLNDCTNVLLTDVSILHSPLWSVRLNDCDRVSIRGIYIFSDLEKGVNADGIDICSSKNVTISDSVITTGDDAIVLKAIARDGKKANPVENITVTNCVLTSSSTSLMIGTETEADIHHVVFNNCVIRNSNKGFGINVQDGATVSNVIFSNLTIDTNRRHWNWWGDAEMCKFVLKKRTDASPLGQIRDIFIDNIIVTQRGTSTITGHAGQSLENIRISNVSLKMDREDAKDKRATDALRIDGVRGLRLRDVAVKWNDQAEAGWQSALVLRNVSDFVVDAFSARQGVKGNDKPVLLLENAFEGTVRNSIAEEGTGTFIHIKGSKTRSIVLRENATTKARTAVSFENDEVRKASEL